jgi:hypothetical protein
MLTYLLAIAVGLGSFSLYMAAFFFPEVYRKYDLVWSGVGMFYALVLWVCAGRITGGVLLGQIASVALLGWFGWQTLQLRRQQTPTAQQTQLPAETAPEVVQATVQQFRANLQQSSHRSPMAAQLNRSIDRIEAVWIELTSWIKALSATVEPSDSNSLSRTQAASSSQKSATTPARTPVTPLTNSPANSPANLSSNSSPNSSVNSSSNSTKEISVEADAVDELYAEWGELEVESYPELDTVDNSAADQRVDLRSNQKPNHSHNGSSRDRNKPLPKPEHFEPE